MLKKLLVASIMMAISSSMAWAVNAPYVGASLGVVNNTATANNFRGVPLTLTAGYGATLNQNVYLGGEVFGTLGTSTLSNNPHDTSLRTTYNYGASFTPGVLLSDHTMTFVRLGVVKTRFSNLSKNTSGGQIGFGMQSSVTQNWDIRGEYDYTKYNNVAGVSPRADAFNVGLVYKFE